MNQKLNNNIYSLAMALCCFGIGQIWGMMSSDPADCPSRAGPRIQRESFLELLDNCTSVNVHDYAHLQRLLDRIEARKSQQFRGTLASIPEDKELGWHKRIQNQPIPLIRSKAEPIFAAPVHTMPAEERAALYLSGLQDFIQYKQADRRDILVFLGTGDSFRKPEIPNPGPEILRQLFYFEDFFKAYLLSPKPETSEVATYLMQVLAGDPQEAQNIQWEFIVEQGLEASGINSAGQFYHKIDLKKPRSLVPADLAE